MKWSTFSVLVSLWGPEYFYKLFMKYSGEYVYLAAQLWALRKMEQEEGLEYAGLILRQYMAEFHIIPIRQSN